MPRPPCRHHVGADLRVAQLSPSRRLPSRLGQLGGRLARPASMLPLLNPREVPAAAELGFRHASDSAPRLRRGARLLRREDQLQRRPPPS
eukprot:6508227-Pyramimonas_sp.AAC.1